MDLQAALLGLVEAPNYRPIKPRAIAKQLKLDDEQTRSLKRVIKALVKSGRIQYAANHLILPTRSQVTLADHTGEAVDVGAGLVPLEAIDRAFKEAGEGTPRLKPKKSSGAQHITGVFRRAQAGFGFVRPAGSAPGADRTLDIYIAADRTLDAASGDTVSVRLRRSGSQSRRPNPEGEIVEVLDRQTRQFVGVYLEAGGGAYVQVDGKVFTRPISVGDPGAKNARPDDKVVFEMVRFPTHAHDGEGVITQVLGARGQPGIDTLSIIHEFNLPGEFAEDTMQAAREQAARFDESLEGRLDLTGETIITIDPVDARDFDDAISLKRLENGHWRLGVHIADVSHFVPVKSALDREAYERATSVYLPDRVIPMLPEIISNNLASLQPDKIRYTKTVFIEFTAEGVRVAIDAHSAAIQSKRRFTYEEVDEFLAARDAWRAKLSEKVHTLLGDMHELAMILRARRFRNGALELSMQEVKVDLDKDGRVAGAHLVKNTESHQMIEEFMLAANEAVAQKLADAELFFLRRVHQAPDLRKLKLLTEFVNELGIPTESLESRFELQRLLDLVRDRPERHAVNYAVLRSLQRAVYSPVEEGHYALASDTYCHFTSPIRRYPDLTVHRLLEALLAGKKPRNNFEEVGAVGEHCSDREQRAEAAERELTKLKLLQHMASRIGEELDGVVTGVEEFGLFVQGVELPAEGLLHITALSDDFYRFDRTAHTLTGRRADNMFRLGDPLRVAVARVDVDRRELDFRLVKRLKRPPAPEKLKAGKRKSKDKSKGKRGESDKRRPKKSRNRDRRD